MSITRYISGDLSLIGEILPIESNSSIHATSTTIPIILSENALPAPNAKLLNITVYYKFFTGHSG